MAKGHSMGWATIGLELEYARVSKGIDKVNKKFDNFGRKLKRIGRSFGGIFAGIGVAKLGGEIVEAGLSMEKMNSALKAVTGSQEAANKEMAFLRENADALGLSLQSTAGAYTNLAASAKGTAMEGEQTRKIFTGVSQASRALGLSADETNGALRAISQMMSKGKVQAEELRGQLGERLPGAFSLAAEAMGVTTAQLDDMLKKGQVTANDLLPKLADALTNKFGKAAMDAADGAGASFAKLRNTWFELRVEVSKFLLPVLQWLVDKLLEAVEAAKSFANAFTKFKGYTYKALFQMFDGLESDNKVVQELAIVFKNLSDEMLHTDETAAALNGGMTKLEKPIVVITKALGEQNEGLKESIESGYRYANMFRLAGKQLQESFNETKMARIDAALEEMWDEENNIVIEDMTESLFNLDEALNQVQNNIQSGFSDLFVDIFGGKGIDSVKDFAKRVLDIFIKLFADIAAAWVTSKIFGGGLDMGGGLLGGGGSILSGIGKIFSGGGSGGLSGIAAKAGSIFGKIFGSTAGGGMAGAIDTAVASSSASIAAAGKSAGSIFSGGFSGMAGAAVPLAIAGFGFSRIASRNKEKESANNQFFSQIGTGTSEQLNEVSNFRGAIEGLNGAADEMFITLNEGWNSTINALASAGAITDAQGAKLDEMGNEMVRLKGNTDQVKAALAGAAFTGYEFGRSIEGVMERGDNMEVQLVGDFAAIQQAMTAATAAGIGGYMNLEQTATGASATLTGDITKWDTFLQGFVNSSIQAAINGMGTLEGSANNATSAFLELATAASKINAGGSVSGPAHERYATGGISDKPAIFGEAGPEAAVPLPDGRTIPVSIKGGGNNSETNTLLKRLIRAVEKNRLMGEGFALA